MLRLRHLCQFLLASIAAFSASLCLGATEANLATEAELDSIKGLGPASTARILQAREQSPFKDWADFLRRVKGFKGSSAARLSEAGLTVNGQPFEVLGQAKAAP
ncbi:MAG: helix-hairpin-helix domain-containing protein [Betaproteobacteria bacterium]